MIRIEELMKKDGECCECGKRHFSGLHDCIIGEDALSAIPGLLAKYSVSHPFVLCDRLTYAAAGERICAALDRDGIKYTLHIIERTHPAPDERIVGEALMHCGGECDSVIAVGGGVINDTCKIISSARNIPDIYASTAPSMDGFASGSSSMERDGLKVSLNSKCPEAVVGDASVLADAPVRMIRSGIGDMVAKYVSIAEWRIASLLLGEYYCPRVAGLVNESLDVCVRSAKAAVSGDHAAVCALTEGLVVSGIAMNYAGISRPASGMEHYISHIIDMRALEFGTPSDFHGIQCGIGTVITCQAYEMLREVKPDPERALAYVSSFSFKKWADHMRERLGHGAEAMIAGEYREKKYDPEKHKARLAKIIGNFDEIKKISETLPSSKSIAGFLESIGHPVSGLEIGLSRDDMREAFLMAKDIRDKYVIGRLLWDLGLLEEFSERITY